MTRFFLAWTAIYAATLLIFAAIDIGTRIWHNLAIINNSGYSDASSCDSRLSPAQSCVNSGGSCEVRWHPQMHLWIHTDPALQLAKELQRTQPLEGC